MRGGGERDAALFPDSCCTFSENRQCFSGGHEGLSPWRTVVSPEGCLLAEHFGGEDDDILLRAVVGVGGHEGDFLYHVLPFDQFAASVDRIGEEMNLSTHVMHEDIFNSMHHI